MQLRTPRLLPIGLQIDHLRRHIGEQDHEAHRREGESFIPVAQHRGGYQGRRRARVLRRDHVGELRDRGVLRVASVWMRVRLQRIEVGEFGKKPFCLFGLKVLSLFTCN